MTKTMQDLSDLAKDLTKDGGVAGFYDDVPSMKWTINQTGTAQTLFRCIYLVDIQWTQEMLDMGCDLFTQIHNKRKVSAWLDGLRGGRR